MSLTFPQTRPNNYCLIFLLVLCLASVIAALGIGRYGLSSAEVLRILWEGLAHKEGDPVLHQIVFNVRLPRILTCAAAGTVLGMCGCALQTIFRNPLVSPNVLGISSGASFGGTLAIFCDLSTWALYSSAIFFGLLTLTLVYFFSRKFREGLLMLILGGMVLNGFFTALVGLLQYLSDSEEKLPAIVFWLMGSFSSATMPKFFLFAIPVIVCGVLMIGLRWRLNLLSLDEKCSLFRRSCPTTSLGFYRLLRSPYLKSSCCIGEYRLGRPRRSPHRKIRGGRRYSSSPAGLRSDRSHISNWSRYPCTLNLSS